ncbi:MerR family transcriptional regulator [Streptomyces sp. DSM 44917]|uniref:MerR family transcriptional regulator n=1 Tax=Streptomyces boetiae TaxID=3075541 RepID=A0ABU2LBY9_9ACTN|nr:MerR family transcriptional regulator [Streptomyces sp. DSM 44917]MDT0309084.1 MerR family transcriptional regulator [Streptomyces sp. DSM 44917]
MNDTETDARVPATREYRAAELAEAAGITLRTLRFYRERKLLPPPRREGRIVWYGEDHLARLRTISALLARGHTLVGVAELLAAFAAGRDAGQTAELLGLEERAPFSDEERVRLTPPELAAYFAGQETPENLAESLELGYIAVDGEEVVHASRDLLESSAALVTEGIPLAAILEVARSQRANADALATAFAGLLRRYVLPDLLGAPGEAAAGPLSEEGMEQLAKALERLRPLMRQVVYAEVSLALDRHLRRELGQPE